MKKNSHLCVGNEKWGLITNNQEWLDNALAFLQKNKYSEKADFICGYCCHILADIQNNIKVWTPFRIKNEIYLKNGAGSLYHQEANAIDYELYLLRPERIQIWQLLKNAVGYDISNIVFSDEINKMKNSILHEQFTNRESADISLNEYVTLSSV